ncbi:hypothetical protein Acr_15g0004070 [Actinidia rufa]|uniref:Uncharacterized protein n=1 Tax=Actinidia rufa TaxID=165716 RepID=A0A7J0FV30_9ERIC|nr:hypothetical protein Acr_15g0004070 [Actinidia rufa]
MDGDERGRQLLQSLSPPELSSTIPDQMAFAAPSGTRPYYQHCRKPGNLIDRYFNLHPKLKQQFFRNSGGGRGGGHGRTQIVQLQLHLGLAPSTSSGPMTAIVVGTLTALHGPPSPLHLTAELFAEESIPPRPLPILESPPSPSGSLPSIVTTEPSKIYSLRSRSPDPVLASSPNSGISSPLVSDIPPPRYPTRVHRLPSRFLLSNSINHPIVQHLSY